MTKENKKALSPIIATVLLISLGLVLATIVYLFARGFIPEGIAKFEQPIAESCKKVMFEASYENGGIIVQNTGNVPLYGIDISLKSAFATRELANFSGASYLVEAGGVTSYSGIGEIESGSEIRVMPILLGKSTDTEEKKAFICGEEYSKSIIV
jgi:FlaG/FlaF family flagellin (archaellin)